MDQKKYKAIKNNSYIKKYIHKVLTFRNIYHAQCENNKHHTFINIELY